MGQTQKPIFFSRGTKGQVWFNRTTVTIQDTFQAKSLTMGGADVAVKGWGSLPARALTVTDKGSHAPACQLQSELLTR